MRFSGRFRFPELDFNAFKKKQDEAIQTQMRQAARAWLRAMLQAHLPSSIAHGGSTIGIPPVWTGTARGTLLPLGRALHVSVPISPIVYRQGFGPQVGASLGRFRFDQKFGRYYFSFSTSLWYMNLNEFEHSTLKLTHQTPWGGLRIGQAAFKAYIEEALPKRLPGLEKALRYTTRVVR